MKMKCPRCKAKLEVDRAADKDRCPVCGTEFAIPHKPPRPAPEPKPPKPPKPPKTEGTRSTKPFFFAGASVLVLGLAAGGYFILRPSGASKTPGGPASGSPAAPPVTTTGEQRTTPQRDDGADRELARLRAENERLRAQASQAATPTPAPKPLTVVRGGAWVTRKSGTSDLLRGLDVALLNDTLVDPAVIRAEYQDKLGRLAEERDSLLREYREEKARNDKEEQERQMEPIRNMEDFNKEWADKLAHIIAARQADMAKITARENLLSAYRHFANANSYYGTTDFYRCAATAVRQKVHADSEGKFVFTDIPLGRYYVYAVMNNSTSFIEWLVPIDVADGKEVRCDLYNENASTIYNKN